VAPELPGGWITLTRVWPLAGVQVLGPLWPLVLVNPFYIWLAHRRGQLVCPLDPTPDARLGWYLRLGCDAILSDNPAATARALERRAARRRPPAGAERGP
jgi:glycerophosphoryl diester phosphodiesterase